MEYESQWGNNIRCYIIILASENKKTHSCQCQHEHQNRLIEVMYPTYDLKNVTF